MESVLASLSGLLVRALPTFLLLLILHFYLRTMFYGPLGKALKQRQDATTGFKKQAADAIANAESKAAQYEEALRAARGEIYREQEETRKRWRAEQTAAVAGLRGSMEADVAEKRSHILAEKQAQQAALSVRSEELAEQIANSVLGAGA
jgi:F-type H+-transporting ATPase subunit b